MKKTAFFYLYGEKSRLAAPDQQISLGDPDVRSMNHCGNGIVGYNLPFPAEMRMTGMPYLRALSAIKEATRELPCEGK